MSTEEKKTSRPHQLKEGTLLRGRYRIESVVGEGGFGITYFGVDETLELDVAIKEYFPGGIATRHTETSSEVNSSSPDDEEQYLKGKHDFLKEARTLAKFQNVPGIVSVKDYFEDNNTAYIVMERLYGTDLRTWLKEKGIMTFDEAFRLLSPVMASLAKVHETGLIHRDISPANIMVQKDGTVKLLDFGAARAINKTGDLTLSVVLKPGYSPEEQYRTKGIQGPWTDVYSMCATIYRMITGMQPDDSLQRLLLDELKTPSQLGISIDPLVEEVLMKGLSIRGEDRWQSMSALKKAFESCFDEPSQEPGQRPAAPVIPMQKIPSAEQASAPSGGSVSSRPAEDRVSSRPAEAHVSRPETSRPVYEAPEYEEPSYEISSGGQGPEKPKKKGKAGLIAAILAVCAIAAIVLIIVNPFGSKGDDSASNITDTTDTATNPPETETVPLPPSGSETEPPETETETETKDAILESAGLNLFYGLHEYKDGWNTFVSRTKTRTVITDKGNYILYSMPYDFLCFQSTDGKNIIAAEFMDEKEGRFFVIGYPFVDDATLYIEPVGSEYSEKYYAELLERAGDEFGITVKADQIELLNVEDSLYFSIKRDYGDLVLQSPENAYGLSYICPLNYLKGSLGKYGSTSTGNYFTFNNSACTGINIPDINSGSDCIVYFENGGYTEDATLWDYKDSIAVISVSWTKSILYYNGRLEEFEKNGGLTSIRFFNTAPFGFILVPWGTDDIYYFQQPLTVNTEKGSESDAG
ncbi:MAG: serine/threonine protein kinase [Lachnospiraceae bacterium]|nr:serine/threonine protein kinase [Lachnospiraceae bacterium]